jgi:predicted dehydrogenase
MAGENLRIGFVGAGGIVRDRHVPGLRTVPGVEFYGVVNRSPESSQRAAEEFGIERTYDSWEQLVQDPQIDIVWIGAHPYMHRIVTEAALEAGKHVFTQARMAINYADAKAMYEASERHPHLTTMISPPPHFMRGDRAVRKLINEGYIGEPRNVVVQSYADTYLNPNNPIHWRQNWDISGLNVLDMGMMIEVMHRWLGYARRVTAMAQTFVKERPDGQGGTAPVERPDTVSIIAELESGAIATINCSGVARHAAASNGFEIFGTEGVIRYLTAGDTILIGKTADAELTELKLKPEEERRWEAEAEFIAAVRAGSRKVEPSFLDGLKYMEMTEAVFRSVETGKTIDLPLD